MQRIAATFTLAITMLGQKTNALELDAQLEALLTDAPDAFQFAEIAATQEEACQG